MHSDCLFHVNIVTEFGNIWEAECMGISNNCNVRSGDTRVAFKLPVCCHRAQVGKWECLGCNIMHAIAPIPAMSQSGYRKCWNNSLNNFLEISLYFALLWAAKLKLFFTSKSWYDFLNTSSLAVICELRYKGYTILLSSNNYNHFITPLFSQLINQSPRSLNSRSLKRIHYWR